MSPIKKLLVANRGEIAVRIFRACREMGIATVAVYSEIDREAHFLNYADESYFIGGTPPNESYLNIPNILEAAQKAGASAIHPGYGFLAENPRFASAVEEAGLIWVGPPPAAITAMGDKVSARAVAKAAGVESVPGTESPIKDASEIQQFAEKYGWPVAIKAAHGGGGRGFRVVKGSEDAESSFESAAREAQLAFGNPDVYLERYLEEPRHVEVQVIGDSHGTVVHLGERDCSLQRRHQKLVEESPSPAVDPETREAMGTAAVKVAAAAGYYSAGTVEFLLEITPDGPRFWFLEMNTRLQVEHPVTELVTGIDLAKEMISVASGERLSFDQASVGFRGHAIELRINAEDSRKKFMPNPGTITSYAEPTGPGVRVDSGVTSGSMIPQSYDSLIAKLICYGSDRAAAIATAERALGEFVIEGVRTTIPFHLFALGSEWFRSGEFSTKTVESLDLAKLIGEETGAARPPRPRAGAGPANERIVTVELDGKKFEAKVWDQNASRTKPSPPALKKASKHGGTGEMVTATMQGVIVKTLVEQGAEVSAGDAILVLEAMKMENLVHCHRDGVVKELRVKAGDPVQSGAVLAVIE